MSDLLERLRPPAEAKLPVIFRSIPRGISIEFIEIPDYPLTIERESDESFVVSFGEAASRGRTLDYALREAANRSLAAKVVVGFAKALVARQLNAEAECWNEFCRARVESQFRIY